MEIYRSALEYIYAFALAIVGLLPKKLADLISAWIAAKAKKRDAEDAIRLSLLHKERVAVSAETYARLLGLLATVREHTREDHYFGLVANDTTFDAITKAIKDFKEYFIRHQLLLPKEIIDKIAEFADALWMVILDFEENIRPNSHGTTEEWARVSCALDTKIPAILSDVEYQFRTLLGSS